MSYEFKKTEDVAVPFLGKSVKLTFYKLSASAQTNPSCKEPLPEKNIGLRSSTYTINVKYLYAGGGIKQLKNN